MQITIEKIKIEGNKQLDKVLKFEKELKRICSKYIEADMTTDGNVTMMWDGSIVKYCTIKKKHKKLPFLKEFFDEKNK